VLRKGRVGELNRGGPLSARGRKGKKTRGLPKKETKTGVRFSKRKKGPVPNKKKLPKKK